MFEKPHTKPSTSSRKIRLKAKDILGRLLSTEVGRNFKFINNHILYWYNSQSCLMSRRHFGPESALINGPWDVNSIYSYQNTWKHFWHIFLQLFDKRCLSSFFFTFLYMGAVVVQWPKSWLWQCTYFLVARFRHQDWLSSLRTCR